VKRIVVIGGVTMLAAAAWMFLRPSTEERSARVDVAAVSSAVAAHITESGRLPRIMVSSRRNGSGDEEWGEHFLVESHQVPRADATSARLFNLVGTVERWCVEMLYSPAATLGDASPAGWVAARGHGDEVGGVEGGRCGADYSMVLSPSSTDSGPVPGSVIDAVSAPIGTCLSDVIHDGRSTAPLEVVGCGTEHFAEIYHAGAVNAGSYAQFQDTAATACAAAFPGFVGVSSQLSALAAEPFTSSEEQWQGGARQFSCVLFLSAADYPLVGSARDSWR
jgi:hypothetical protein